MYSIALNYTVSYYILQRPTPPPLSNVSIRYPKWFKWFQKLVRTINVWDNCNLQIMKISSWFVSYVIKVLSAFQAWKLIQRTNIAYKSMYKLCHNLFRTTAPSCNKQDFINIFNNLAKPNIIVGYLYKSNYPKTYI